MKLQEISTNFHLVTLGELEVWFSYETPIAFRHKGTLIVSENIWSKTTAKHLNQVSKNMYRVPNQIFQEKLKLVSP